MATPNAVHRVCTVLTSAYKSSDRRQPSRRSGWAATARTNTRSILFSDPLSTRRHLSGWSSKTKLTNLLARQELQTENASQTDGVQAIRPSPPLANILDGGLSIVPIDQLGLSPLSAFVPIDALPVAEPLIGYSPSAIPAPAAPSAPFSPSAIPAPAAPSAPFWPISSGPGGGGAVPEPSTWVMMLAGFASLWFAGYRASGKRNRLGGVGELFS